MAKKSMSDDEFEHGWAAKARFPDDDRLRAAGFELHGRVRVKGKLQSTWERDGAVFTEEEALGLLQLIGGD